MANSTSQSFISTYSNIGTKVIFSNIDTDVPGELKNLITTISENNDPSIFIILNKKSVSKKFNKIILYDPFVGESYKDKITIFEGKNIA